MLQKPIYLNNKIYLLLLESLSLKEISDLKTYSEGNNRQDLIEYILLNPSKYLLKEIKIFETPRLLEKVIFDIDDLEFMFSEESMLDLEDKKDNIRIKRVVDSIETKVALKDIKKSFEAGCLFDCQNDK